MRILLVSCIPNSEIKHSFHNKHSFGLMLKKSFCSVIRPFANFSKESVDFKSFIFEPTVSLALKFFIEVFLVSISPFTYEFVSVETSKIYL